MSAQRLTRRRVIGNAALLTAALALPTAMGAPDVEGYPLAVAEPAAVEPAARATVDLDALGEAEQDTVAKLCAVAGVLMTDDEAADVLAAAWAADRDGRDFDGLLATVDGERRMLELFGRRATAERLYLTDERKAAGILVGLGFVTALPVETFARAHAMMPDAA